MHSAQPREDAGGSVVLLEQIRSVRVYNTEIAYCYRVN